MTAKPHITGPGLVFAGASDDLHTFAVHAQVPESAAPAATLQWTRTLPTVPGWYWAMYRNSPEFSPKVAEVDFDENGAKDDDDPGPLAVRFTDYWEVLTGLPLRERMLWAGPIPQPEEPKEPR